MSLPLKTSFLMRASPNFPRGLPDWKSGAKSVTSHIAGDDRRAASTTQTKTLRDSISGAGTACSSLGSVARMGRSSRPSGCLCALNALTTQVNCQMSSMKAPTSTQSSSESGASTTSSHAQGPPSTLSSTSTRAEYLPISVCNLIHCSGFPRLHIRIPDGRHGGKST